MRFEKDTVIIEQGQRPNEVCFVMSGSALNRDTGRAFNVGYMFGEADIVFNRERRDTYIAEVETYLMKFDRKTFMKIMHDFPEIKAEIHDIAKNRDKIRENSDNIKDMASKDSIKDAIKLHFQNIKEKELIDELKLDLN